MPIFVTDQPRLAVTPSNGVRIAAWVVRDDGGGLTDGLELVARDGVLSTMLSPGGHTLVVTGLTRNTIATAIEVALTAPVEEPPPDDDSGGCSTTEGGSSRSTAALLLAAVLLRCCRHRRMR